MTLKSKIVETAFAYLRDAFHRSGVVLRPLTGDASDAIRYSADLGNGETAELACFQERGQPGLWLRMHCDGERLPMIDAYLTGKVLRARIGATGADDGPEIDHQAAIDFMMSLASRVLSADGSPFAMSELAPGMRS